MSAHISGYFDFLIGLLSYNHCLTQQGRESSRKSFFSYAAETWDTP